MPDELKNIELEPFQRIMYWNKKLKQTWGPRIVQIKKAYYQTELATVLAGMRDVYVYHVNSSRWDQSYDFLRNNGLEYYPVTKSASYKGFSHRHLPVVEGQPFHIYGAAVKRGNDESAQKFYEYSLSDPANHRGIGELLGYPECCIDFFDSKWGVDSIDPMWEIALETEGSVRKDNTVTIKAHPYCNNMLRYFGIRLTPHIPHSFQCEETIKWGEEWFEILTSIDEEAAQWAYELSSMPSTWDCYKGVVMVTNSVFRGVTNSDRSSKRLIVENEGWVE